MNSSIQAIGPSQSVKPSFGMLNVHITRHYPNHPIYTIGAKNWEDLVRVVKPLKNIILDIGDDGVKFIKHFPEKVIKKTDEKGVPVFDKKTGAEIIEKIIPPHTEEHFVDMDYHVFRYYGNRYLRFEDGSFRLGPSYSKNEVQYGYRGIQRVWVAIKNAATKLNNPEQEFDLCNIYSKQFRHKH